MDINMRVKTMTDPVMNDSVANAMTDPMTETMTAVTESMPAVTESMPAVTETVPAVSEAMSASVMSMLSLHAADANNRQ